MTGDPLDVGLSGRWGNVPGKVAAVTSSPETDPVVFVVDDDSSMRETLDSLIRSVGLKVKTYASASDFLKDNLPEAPSCLVLDVRLPGIGGLDFQAELAKAGITVPIIFITGHGDIPMTVRAMKAGAVDFLSKPFRDQELLDSVQVALDKDRVRREREKAVTQLRANLETLTAREREVMSLVTEGLMNKQVAGRIGVSEITVKVHRGNVMRKMGARSLADLVRMAELLEIHAPRQ
jgi:FixJ family two-component response regulator